ncbi:cache domain-containing protein, partial [Helicobacter baculiformis]
MALNLRWKIILIILGSLCTLGLTLALLSHHMERQSFKKTIEAFNSNALVKRELVIKHDVFLIVSGIAEYFSQHSKETALQMTKQYFKRINESKGRAYVLALTKEGVLFFDNIHTNLIGQNVLGVQDGHGNHYFQEFIQRALNNPKGDFYRCHLKRPHPERITEDCVSYTYYDPVSGLVIVAVSYINSIYKTMEKAERRAYVLANQNFRTLLYTTLFATLCIIVIAFILNHVWIVKRLGARNS